MWPAYKINQFIFLTELLALLESESLNISHTFKKKITSDMADHKKMYASRLEVAMILNDHLMATLSEVDLLSSWAAQVNATS